MEIANGNSIHFLDLTRSENYNSCLDLPNKVGKHTLLSQPFLLEVSACSDISQPKFQNSHQPVLEPAASISRKRKCTCDDKYYTALRVP